MALIVEDGTGIANADSFVSLVDARAKAALLGIALPADNTQAEIELRKGASYVNNQDSSLSGERLNPVVQTMCYPRENSTKHGHAVANNVVPIDAVNAQISAAATISGGVNPYKINDGKEVKSVEAVGAVKKSYYQSTSNTTESGEVKLTEALAYLKPLMSDSAASGGLASANFAVIGG